MVLTIKLNEMFLRIVRTKEKRRVLEAQKEKIIRFQLLDGRIYQKDSKDAKVEVEEKEAALTQKAGNIEVLEVFQASYMS